MADQNAPPKDLEVRLTELENAVKSLTQAFQPAASTQTQSAFVCTVCHQCLSCVHCLSCYHCTVCRPICITCHPICAECNGCQPL